MALWKLAGLAVAAALVCSGPALAQTKTRVGVGVTGNIAVNPYLESDALNYAIGCQTYGCLGRYDFKTGNFVPMLAERWEVKNPTTWVFHLRRDVKWHNGDPVTAQDVVHSHERRMNDPLSRQKSNGKDIDKIEALDNHTVQITTKTPTATLLFLLYSRLIISNKKLFDTHGAEVADRQHPIGFGPYRVVQIPTGQRFVVEKVPDNPFATADGPDEIVFLNMKEPEQRVTALIKGEIHVAMYVPPHMVDRIRKAPNTDVALADGVEVNFLAMNPRFKPWDNKLVRQAVAHAIDRQTLVDVTLGGLADRLDGPIGKGQYAFDPDLKPKYDYDPAKARELLKQAGFPNGLTVEFNTPVNRYTNDKQTSEAIVAMLKQVGITAQMKTPEWSRLTADVNKGQVAFYYYGRGSVDDPSAFLSQYFETGASDRLGYSNPELDKVLVEERATFDPDKRIALLRKAMSMINEDVPVHFLWRMKQIYGVSKSIDYQPDGSAGVYGPDIKMRRK